MSNKTLLAGPWVGEFGWEIMRWQGIVRHKAQGYQQVIVMCRKESRYLYEDFATQFIDVNAPMSGLNMWMNNCFKYKPTGIDYSQCDIFEPSREICLGKSVEQKFIRYGNQSEHKKYILIHARATTNWSTGYRNWPITNWNELIAKLSTGIDFNSLTAILGNSSKTMISIGTHEGAMHIPWTIDGRGMELKKLCDCMGETEMLVSPSSGPAHLASLCGCPHVVWGGMRYQPVIDGNNCDRYKTLWNPFGTKCEFIETKNDWNPKVEEVLEGIHKCRIQ